MKDYAVIKCLGHQNVAKAIREHSEWDVHSLVFGGVERLKASPLARETIQAPAFILLLERDVEEAENDEPLHLVRGNGDA